MHLAIMMQFNTSAEINNYSSYLFLFSYYVLAAAKCPQACRINSDCEDSSWHEDPI